MSIFIVADTHEPVDSSTGQSEEAEMMFVGKRQWTETNRTTQFSF